MSLNQYFIKFENSIILHEADQSIGASLPMTGQEGKAKSPPMEQAVAD